MAHVWQLQEAKNKLSEVIEEAVQNGPQVISRRGAEIAVVLSYEEYLTLKKSRKNLAQFFLESPLRGSGIDLERDRRPAGRDVSL
jgi:prevent-host-death family protein